MILLCQGAGGLWTGLGWATPGGGQAPIRSHGPPRLVGGVDRSLQPTVEIDRCCHMCVGMSVDTTSYTYDSHGRPFRIRPEGWQNHRDGGRDPTELG
jgi:hypothetical protein